MTDASAATAVLPEPGATVRITGLKNDKRYNDMIGTVQRTTRIGGRNKAVVILRDSGRELALLPGNLQELVQIKGNGLVFVRTTAPTEINENAREVILQELRAHFPFLADSVPAFWVSHEKKRVQEELQQQDVLALVNYIPALGAKVACLHCMQSIRDSFVRCSQCCKARYCSQQCETEDVHHKQVHCSTFYRVVDNDNVKGYEAYHNIYRYIRKELKETEPCLRAAAAAFFETCVSCGFVCTDSKKTLLMCETCKCVRYCSVECSRQHWIKHKTECQALKCGLQAYIGSVHVIQKRPNMKPFPHDLDGKLLTKNQQATDLWNEGFVEGCESKMHEACRLLQEEASGWRAVNDPIGEARAYYQLGLCAGNCIDGSQGLLNLRKSVKILNSIKAGKAPGAASDLLQDAKRTLGIFKSGLNCFCVDIFFTAFFAVNPVEEHPLREFHEGGGASSVNPSSNGTQHGKATIRFLKEELKGNRALQSLCLRLQGVMQDLCEKRRQEAMQTISSSEL
tara:strand:- start:2007 stop:3539 length:1533 start_codon:yes stop_codon:yes gene_type:complete